MSIDQFATAPPQLSPDGHWWWDGAAWIPASQAPHAAEPGVAVAPLVVEAPVAALDPAVAVQPLGGIEAVEPASVVDPSSPVFATLAELAADPVPAAGAPATWQPARHQSGGHVPAQLGASDVDATSGPPAPSSPFAPSEPLAQPWSPQGFGAAYSPGLPVAGRPSSGDGRGMGIASLVLGLLGLCGLGSLLAVVLGHVSRRRDRQAGVAPNGLALAGLIIGYVGLAVLPLLLAIAVPTFLAQKAKSDAMEVTDELKRAALAQEAWAVQNGGYTRSVAELGTTGYVTDAQVSVQVVGADRGEFCLRGTSRSSSSVVLYVDSTSGTIGPQPCT